MIFKIKCNIKDMICQALLKLVDPAAREQTLMQMPWEIIKINP